MERKRKKSRAGGSCKVLCQFALAILSERSLQSRRRSDMMARSRLAQVHSGMSPAQQKLVILVWYKSKFSSSRIDHFNAHARNNMMVTGIQAILVAGWNQL